MIFRISSSMQIKSFLISAGLAAAMYRTIINIDEIFFSSKMAFLPTPIPIVSYFIVVILVLIPITAVHEVIHGAFYKIYGGRPVYGFKVVYAYTMEVTGKPILRNRFLLLLLAPVTIISVLCTLLPGIWGSAIMVLNLIGSSGDLYMAWSLRRLPCQCCIIDRPYGYEAII